MLSIFHDVTQPGHIRKRIGERLHETQPAAALVAAVCEHALSTAKETSRIESWMRVRTNRVAAELVASMYGKHPEHQPLIERFMLKAMREQGTAQFVFAVVEAEGEHLLMKLVPVCVEKILDEQDLCSQGILRWSLSVLVDSMARRDLLGASAFAGNLMEKATRDARRAALVASMLTDDLKLSSPSVHPTADKAERPKGVGKTFLAPWGLELSKLAESAMGLSHAASDAFSKVEYGREIVAALESPDATRQITGLFCILTSGVIIDRALRERAKAAVDALTLEKELFVYRIWIASAREILRGWDEFFSRAQS